MYGFYLKSNVTERKGIEGIEFMYVHILSMQMNNKITLNAQS